ncbi:MAG: hypothetical protein KBT04_03190 [Bacteroidales bacterium]|nr:hypothetical protein [Candidatus Colimorpha onthohippi]
MKLHLRFTLFLMVACHLNAWAVQPWNDASYFSLNKLSAHPTIIDNVHHEWHQTLQDEWRYNYKTTPDQQPKGFPSPNTSSWEVVTIPHLSAHRQGSAYYATQWELPNQWRGMRIMIKCGGGSSAMQMYINGNYVGYSEDSFAPAEWDISRYLHTGTNHIMIRLIGESDGSLLEPADLPIGLLRPVEIFAVPSLYIANYHVLSTIDNNTKPMLDITVDLSAEVRGGNSICVTLIDTTQHPYKTLATATKKLEHKDWFVVFSPQDIQLPEETQLWSPDHPYCYQLQISASNTSDSNCHTVTMPIAFKRITIQDDRILLNNKPFQIRAVSWREPYQGLTPDSLRHLLTNIKNTRLNTIILQAPASDDFYTLCSQMGILVVDQPAIMPRADIADSIGNHPDWQESYLYRAINLYQRHRHIPCVAAWIMNPALTQSSNGKRAARLFTNRAPYQPTINPFYITTSTNQKQLQSELLQFSYNPLDYQLTLYDEYKRRHPVMAIYNPMEMSLNSLMDCCDTLRTHMTLPGAYFGTWQKIGSQVRTTLTTHLDPTTKPIPKVSPQLADNKTNYKKNTTSHKKAKKRNTKKQPVKYKNLWQRILAWI